MVSVYSLYVLQNVELAQEQQITVLLAAQNVMFSYLGNLVPVKMDILVTKVDNVLVIIYIFKNELGCSLTCKTCTTSAT